LPDVLDAWTLEDSRQGPESVAERLVAWLGEARAGLDLALYDVRLPGPVGDVVAGALRDAIARGVRVRIAYNDEDPGPDERPFQPPPPSTQPHLLEQLGAQLRGIPGWRDLMHPGGLRPPSSAASQAAYPPVTEAGTRQENVLATVADPAVNAAYARVFGELWERGQIGSSGSFDTPGPVRPWFCPGRGPELSHRIAKRIGAARRRVRIASPLLTSGPILAAVNESEIDLAGVCDVTQVRQVFRQWEHNPASQWKIPLLRHALLRFTGKPSTPYAPGALHDYMHAKVTVADDVVFLGSFNLSRSGEMNAENVLEIGDAALAERLAAWIDSLRARYTETP
jgi:phosphatidylserine/phosphatidylglycerophosphate/cardiolipin synthase-like enzyme